MEVDTKKIIEIFSAEAEKKVQANEAGDYKSANKSYDKIVKAVSALKDSGNIDQLLRLLNDSRAAVRMTAAIFLLPKYESISIPILEEIATNNGVMAFTAEMTLSEWKKGNLNL